MAATHVDPPKGSKISVVADGPDQIIVIPQAGAGLMRYVFTVFILVWLSIWTFAFGAAVWAAFHGTLKSNMSVFGDIFMLAAWAFGEATAIFYLYRLWRPSVPELLKLQASGVAYDSGVPPFRVPLGFAGYADFWRSLFPRRTRIELDRQQLRSLRLRETDSGNRLTVDLDAFRLDIARAAGEIEREWLSQVLKERYA